VRLRRQARRAVEGGRDGVLRIPIPPARARGGEDEERRRLKKAAKLACMGYTAKATDTILQESLADTSTRENFAILTNLHPEGDGIMAPPVPQNAPYAAVTPDEEFVRLIRGTCNGAAADHFGWNCDLLKPLLQSQECIRGMAALVSDVINGTLEMPSFVNSGTVIAITKPQGGLRPICIPTMWQKLASRWMTRSYKRQVTLYLGPSQMAIGVKGGSESAANMSRTMLRERAVKWGSFNTDIKNAFNTISRNHVLSIVDSKEELAFLRRPMHAAYGQPAALYTNGPQGRAVILSRQGVRQGDGLGSMAFAIGIKTAIDNTVVAHPGCKVIAISDNVKFVGAPEVAIDCGERFMEEVRRLGMTCEPSKQSFTYLHGDLADVTRNRLQRINVKLDDIMTIDLGVPISADDRPAQAYLMQTAQKHDVLVDRLLNPLIPAHATMKILRLCAIPRVHFMARTMPPRLTADPLLHVDTRVMQAVIQKCQLRNLTQARQTQITLPRRKGGLGLRPMHRFNQAAYVASMATMSLHMGVLLSDEEVTQLTGPDSMFAQEMRPLTQYCRTIAPNVAHRLPGEQEDFVAFFNRVDPSHLQKAVVNEIEENVFRSMIDIATPTHLLAIQSGTGPDSSAFLDAITPSGLPPMDDRTFSAAIQLRLDCVLTGTQLSFRCGFCNTQVQPAEHIHHFFICSKTRGIITAHRHNAVTHAIARAARAVEATVVVEPRGYGGDVNGGPDISIMIDRKHYMVDVTTRHPVTKVYRERAQSEIHVPPGTAAEEGEAQKLRDFGRTYGVEIGAEYVPFAVESYGWLGSHARSLIADIALRAQSVSSDVGYRIRKELVQNISIAMQRGNAMVLLAGLQASQFFASPLAQGRARGFM
jgi:hypothetical protein